MVDKKKNPIQVADRLFGAVEYLSAHGASTLTEVSEALGLNKSTMHRVLASLEFMNYVTQDPITGKYDLTMKLTELSFRHRQHFDLLQRIHPHLKQLVKASGETVHFVKRDGKDAVYIDKAESDQNQVQMVSRIGSRIPLYRSAVGKAMMATLSEDMVEKMWRQSTIERITPYTITDYEEFLEALADVRRRGYALDNEENEPGVRCVAASLEFMKQEAEYAFSISAPIQRMDNDRIRVLSALILETKKNIQEDFDR